MEDVMRKSAWSIAFVAILAMTVALPTTAMAKPKAGKGNLGRITRLGTNRS
jgi:hypothetical protein